jgi:exonuclease III
MTSRFAAHNPPDVFYVDSSLAPDWIDQGVLADVGTSDHAPVMAKFT